MAIAQPFNALHRNTPVLTVPVGDAAPAGLFMDAASISGGLAFLTGELAKRDEKLHEPLTSTTWPRDMPVKTGGGFVDSVEMFDVSYATTGGSDEGLIGPESTELPTVQADIGKESSKVFYWGHILKVPLIDQQRLQKIGRSLDDILDKGLHLAYDKAMDKSVYIGFQNHGSYGLVNDPKIVTVVADPHTASGEDTDWASKTPDEILSDINRVLVETWAACEYDVSGMANHILIPPKQYTMLVERKVGVTGDKSILSYLLENNIGKNQHVDVQVYPSRWCEKAGTGGKDRMVAYCNDLDRVRFNQTVMLHRVMTQASAADIAYLSPYIAQFSELEWPYRQHAMYMDGI